uniref:hypothetical protein n=1 Tax=Rhodococcus qingshengii TaxID=334542 RepID=UPI001C4DDDD2|nr:hypothetical protein [Rhodococcus qingshengii]
MTYDRDTGPPAAWVDEFTDDPQYLPRRQTTVATPVRPHPGYRYQALPATAAYVPDGSYRLDLDRELLIREDVEVARIDSAGHHDWTTNEEKQAFDVWAHDLQWIQQVPAHTSLPTLGIELLRREARVHRWCETQSQTMLVYASGDDVRCGRWRVEDFLRADRPDDLAFLIRVDPKAAYFWQGGRRHLLVPGTPALLDEYSAGDGLAAAMPVPHSVGAWT